MKEKNSIRLNTTIKNSKPSDETIEMIAWEVLNEINHTPSNNHVEVADDIYKEFDI
ncbi:MAG: hypothetical protein ACLRZ7_01645 [Lachnospiraceae bacterium]